MRTADPKLYLVLLALVISTFWAPLSTAAQTTTLQVDGLAEPVEILVDRWGIPHIYSQTEEDLFFAQGFNAARDRLFQLEMWRRQVTGTVSELLGPRTLDKDIGARLLRYRGDLEQELNHYHERGTAIFGAFVRGVNAYIALTEQEPELLPIEFRLLGAKPGKWTSEVVVSRLNGLYSNVTAEVRNARLLQLMDAETLKSLSDFRPRNPDLSDHGVDLSLIGDDVLKLYVAARAPVDFVAEDIAPTYRTRETVADAAQARLQPGDWVAEGLGSNNWVVGGKRTLSGYPMLANDPHRAVSVPALRYVVHLVGPGWNAIGSGEPTVPAVSMGHNEHGAWGLTIHGRDMEDLYVYDTNPDDPNQYRYQDEWEDMRILRETIPVKGHDDVTVDLKFTRHGPVLSEDPDHNKALCTPGRVAAGGGVPLPGGSAVRKGEELARVSRWRVVPSGAGPQRRVGGCPRGLRLAGHRPRADQELERAPARSGRWPFRVERIHAHQRAPACREPTGWVLRHRKRRERAGRLSSRLFLHLLGAPPLGPNP